MESLSSDRRLDLYRVRVDRDEMMLVEVVDLGQWNTLYFDPYDTDDGWVVDVYGWSPAAALRDGMRMIEKARETEGEA